MKHTTNPALAVASLLFGALFFLAGCESTGVRRAEKTSASMAAVEQDIRQAEQQMDAVAASLQGLIGPGQEDVKKAFGKYVANVEQMDRTGKRIFDHVDRMRERRTEYFEEWRKEGETYSNPEIRALSEERRVELSAIMDRIPEAGAGVRPALQAYLADIRDIRTYLSNDLTPRGIEAITPSAQTAMRDGDRLKAAFLPWLAAISDARAELAKGGAR